MTIGRAVKALVIVVGVGTMVAPAVGFEPSLHTAMTRYAIPANKKIDADALRRVTDANEASDAHQLDFERHFDNARNPAEICARWTRGLNTYMDRAITLSRPIGVEKRELEDRDQALDEFGKVTHALQDFYSHTNWIELHEGTHGSAPLSIPEAPILAQICSPSALPPELHSGYFDATSVSRGIGCDASALAAGWECHTTLNKDTAAKPRGGKQYGSGPGNHHLVANALAQRATESAWQVLADRIEARYESDTTNGKCVFAKLAWGGDRSCHKKWGATGMIKTHQEYVIPGGRLFHELDMNNLTLSFKIDSSVGYPGPNEPPVYADVRGTTHQRGTFCQWAVTRNGTTPKTCMPYSEDTIDSDDAVVKVTPYADPIELDWRVTFPGKKPDCGNPLIVRIDPAAPARQPFLNCPGGMPGLAPAVLTYEGTFTVAPE